MGHMTSSCSYSTSYSRSHRALGTLLRRSSYSTGYSRSLRKLSTLIRRQLSTTRKMNLRHLFLTHAGERLVVSALVKHNS